MVFSVTEKADILYTRFRKAVAKPHGSFNIAIIELTRQEISMTIFALPFHCPVPSEYLPASLISLEEWVLIRVQGPDSTAYLQGQLTLDVANLAATEHHLCAHCDAKGKMWGILRLFHREDSYGYLIRRSLYSQQLSELKKYAVFSRVTLEEDPDAVLLGCAGQHARSRLASLFSHLPDVHSPVVQSDNVTLLWFAAPSERFLLVTTHEQARQLRQQLNEKVVERNSAQWQALEMEAGLPILDAQNSARFIPQALNLQALDAISFQKGCYAGQEMVARAKYRGANKRAMFWLTGSASTTPQPGDALELQMGENWRRTGTLLSIIRLKQNAVWVQAVLNNDLDPDSRLRVAGDADSELRIRPLPYTLTEA